MSQVTPHCMEIEKKKSTRSSVDFIFMPSKRVASPRMPYEAKEGEILVLRLFGFFFFNVLTFLWLLSRCSPIKPLSLL